jgi:hypothetical protein
MAYRSTSSSGATALSAKRNQKVRHGGGSTHCAWRRGVCLLIAVALFCGVLVIGQVVRGRVASAKTSPTTVAMNPVEVHHELTSAPLTAEQHPQTDMKVGDAVVEDIVRAKDAQRALDAIAVDLASDRLLIGDTNRGASAAADALRLRWSPLAFLRSSEWFALRIAAVLRKQRVDSAHLTSEELTSLHRYRLGGIGLLLGKSDSQFSQQIPFRCLACESIEQLNITSVMIESPRNPSDAAFAAFTARRKMERIHHCFAQQSMFLLATFAAGASVFEQIEMIMGLLYLSAISSRTVVIPSIRLASGKRVPLSHVFDVRLLYTSAATGYAQQPVVCVLEEDEFVALETARLDLLQQKQQPVDISNDAAAAALYGRLKDTSCLQATWQREVTKSPQSDVTVEDHINCEEVLNVYFPTMMTFPIHTDSLSSSGLDATSTIETERALDEAVLELAGSFHRVIHVGPLITSALSMLIPSALRGLEKFMADAQARASHLDAADRPLASPAARLHRCLWRLLQPHPFARRGAKLFDLVTEELVPSPSGRALTLSERNTDPEAPPVSAASRPTHGGGSTRSTALSPWRRGGVSIHHHPVFPGGVTCLGLEKFYVLRGGGPLCQLSDSALTVVVDGLRNGSAVSLHYGAQSEAEAFLLVRQIERAIDAGQQTTVPAHGEDGGAPFRPNPLSVRHVLKSPNLLHRPNRLTRFIQAVEDRRKLFLGKGNLLLQGGFSDMATAECPFALHNPFAAEPGLLRDLIEFWSMSLDDGFVSTSPWSAMTRAVLMRRQANAA